MTASIAVIGHGRWGSNLARNFAKLGELGYLCDTNEAALAQHGHDYLCTTDYRQLLSIPSVKGVVIATPSETHYEIAQEALRAGKDVFVEKPLALSVPEGRGLVQIAAQEKRILLVGHLLEYHPAVVRLKEIVDEGTLGKVNYISSTRLDFGYVQYGSDVLWTFAPHDLDTVLLLTERLPVSVTTIGGDYIQQGAVDVSMNALDFGDGLKAVLFLSWLYPLKERRLVVVGDRGMAVFDDVGKDKLTLYPQAVSWKKGRPVARTSESQPVEVDHSEPLLLECLDFIECIRTRRSPRVSTERALQVLELLVACQKSASAGGQPVLLADDNKPVSEYYVHPTATVDPGATIGKSTKVWHYAHISRGARIGEGCVVGHGSYIGPGVRVGDNTRIQNNVSVYEGVTLEDNVFCGPSCVFTNDKYPTARARNRERWQTTLVRSGAAIGANATILCGVVIGRNALVGAGSVVTKSVPDEAVVFGNPAKERDDRR